MIGREFKFHNGKKGAALAIRIHENSDQDIIKKVLMDGTVVVHLKRTSGDPKELLVEYLSTALNIDQDRFDIIDDKDGMDVLLSILDIEPSEIQKKILDSIS